ncbi:phage tail protein [Frankia sp. Cj5]|uniref:phage tail protein n=1 Tax=Frankia sp. Cj5 TaxID=2880978 RepID=UPI001EF53F72|nr:phage tail protein [Frankia sp. Cj5]
MRGAIEGLGTPFPLRDGLPGVLLRGVSEAPLEAGTIHGLLAAFDDVLAPILATVDNIDAYLDPALTPADFLPWLAGWLGVELDAQWPAERVRQVLAAAAETLRWRGTPRGIAAAVRAATGVDPEVSDSGGVAFSPQARGAFPGSPDSLLVVRVPPGTDLAAVSAAVASAKPAHVPHRVEHLRR